MATISFDFYALFIDFESQIERARNLNFDCVFSLQKVSVRE